MTDLTPEAPEEFTAFAVVDAATGGKVVVGMSDPGPEQVGAICRYVRADTIRALRAAPVAMRERAARVAWESEDVYGARGMYGMAKCARNIAAAIRALPLDAPAPVDPVAEAARVEWLAKWAHGFVMADRWKGRRLDALPPDEWHKLREETRQFWRDEAAKALRALAQETRHD